VLPKLLAFGVLLALAFGLRAAFFFIHAAPKEFPDSAIYHQIAVNVCSGKGLTQDPQTALFRPPGYPLFLAGCYSVFGPNLRVVGFAQAVLGALTALVIFFLARYLFDDTTGWIAAAIAAVYPFFVFYSALLLTETLFIALLTGGMALLIHAARSQRLGSAALAGLVLGLGVLTRSSLIGFIVFVAPFWWLATRARGLGRSAQAYALMLLGLAIVLSPWVIRNYRLTGHLVLTTLQAGHDLYEANSPEATGGPASHLIDWDKATEGRKLTEYERDRFLRGKALAYIRDHPGRFLRLAVVKFARFWSPIPNYEKYRTSLYNTLSLLSFGPVLGLAVAGAVQFRRRWPELLLLLSPVCYYSLLHTVFVGSTRYRTPVEPFLIVLAAYALRTLAAGKSVQTR
jgi:4-amino-4-deoxy-L-arabinose transferase-like glycosyltransferase